MVRRMVDGLVPSLEAALNADCIEAELECAGPGDALVEVMDELIQPVTPSLDPRVLRRILREMWNALAGVVKNPTYCPKRPTAQLPYCHNYISAYLPFTFV
jgi:hypothetical protein